MDILLKIFGFVTNLELDEKNVTFGSHVSDQADRLKEMLNRSKKRWSKMCRMMANLYIEKSSQTKTLIKKGHYFILFIYFIRDTKRAHSGTEFIYTRYLRLYFFFQRAASH